MAIVCKSETPSFPRSVERESTPLRRAGCPIKNSGHDRRRFTGLYRWRIIFFLLLLFFAYYLFLPRTAAADGIGGYIELNYSNTVTNAEDETGETTRTKADNFNQLYNISLRRTFTPTVVLNAGSIFERNNVRSSLEGDVTKFTANGIRPYFDLTLRNPVFTAGANYNLREERSKGTDTSAITTLNENYSAIFGWRPEGFPSANVRYESSETFDRARAFQDTVNDTLSMSFQYVPEYEYLRGLEVRYLPSYSEITDNINDAVSTNLAHNARLTYSGLFFKRRVSVYGSYNIAHSESELTTSSTTAELSFQLSPFSGLSKIDDTPENVVLDKNSPLIDGDLTAGAGIDIGLPPTGGSTKPRNIGMDFVVETEVNNIFIWTDRDLPGKIAGSFRWDVYTSPDNQHWTFLTTVPAATFGPFQNRFEINFANVTTRYIKVVTSPLKVSDTIGVRGDFSNILVTEIQAFLKKPPQQLERKIQDTATNQILNLDVKTQILDVPLLFYEFSYYLTQVASSFTNWTVSNGLSASHSFTRIFSGQARVTREDSLMQEENGVAYLYNASVTARPFNTLTHTLNYSGQIQDVKEGKSHTNAVFLNNVAELYRGINLNVNGGVSFQSRDTGEDTTNTIFSIGSGIIPHKRVTIDLYYSDTNSKQSGGLQDDRTDYTRRGTFGVSYKPVNTVYLFVSFETVKTPDDTNDLQNYGVNWSPFPDGSLQFTFSYSENVSSDGDVISLLNPSVRWNINSRTFLELSGQVLSSESVSSRTDSVVSSAAFRTVF